MAVPVTEEMKVFDSQLLSNIMHDKHDETQPLLQSSADLQNLIDDVGLTLLHYAAQYGNAIVVQYLIDKGCKIDSLDESGNSPLMLAVKSEHVATIEVLLNAKADVNIRDKNGRTILERILQSGVLTRSLEVKTLFLNRVKIMCNDDDTLIANKLMETGCNLIEAIHLNRSGVVKVMLEKGISIEDRDANYNTTLHVAVELMNLEIIKLLIQHGARVDAKGCHGRTPITRYKMRFEDTDAKLDILRYLLHQGTRLTIPDLFGMTPIIFLLCGADREILEVLIECGVDFCGFNKFHQNPLHHLIENKTPGVLEALRGKNFLVDARNGCGFTPLLMAVQNYDLEKIEFLLEHGADINAQSPDGHTALILLFKNRLEEEKNVSNILELLLDRGADIQTNFKCDLTIFDLAEQNHFYFRIKPAIAKLVLCEVLGKQIDKWIRKKINWNLIYVHHYEKCKLQIRQLRYKIVHGSVSLYKLLFESEEKLILYARNSQFKLKFMRLMAKVNNVDIYIFHTLTKRVNKAIEIAELKKRAAIAICRITELPISTYPAILYKIIDYLDNEDLEKLHHL